MSSNPLVDGYTQRPARQMLDIRLVGAVSGTYLLANARDKDTGKPRPFSCHTQSISTKQIVLSAPVTGDLQEQVVVKLDDFRPIHGWVARRFPGGFAMDLEASDEERAEIAAKIDWIKKRRFRSFKERRDNKRYVPASPRSAVTLPDGSIHECLIIDVSRTGVAVSMELQPKIGTRAAVGKAPGTIVRHIETGFAVQFDTELEEDEVEGVFAWSMSYLKNKDQENQSAAE